MFELYVTRLRIGSEMQQAVSAIHKLAITHISSNNGNNGIECRWTRSGGGAAAASPIDICMRYLSAQLDAGASLRANGTLSSHRVALEKWRPPRSTDHTAVSARNK